MESRIEYIFNPQTLVSFIIFVFWLGAAWTRLNNRLKECEKRLDKIDELDLNSRLTQMQIDLDWVKKSQDEIKAMLQKK